MHCEKRMSWFLLFFEKHFSNYLQIPSKYSNIMLAICKISLRKIANFCYIFSNANGIEKSEIY